MSTVRFIDAAELAAMCKPDTAAVLAFVATWNKRCQAFMPDYQDLATRWSNRLPLVCIDVDESPALVNQFEVCSVPTLLMLRGGRVVWRQTGLSLDAIEAMLNDF